MICDKQRSYQARVLVDLWVCNISAENDDKDKQVNI